MLTLQAVGSSCGPRCPASSIVRYMYATFTLQDLCSNYHPADYYNGYNGYNGGWPSARLLDWSAADWSRPATNKSISSERNRKAYCSADCGFHMCSTVSWKQHCEVYVCNINLTRPEQQLPPCWLWVPYMCSTVSWKQHCETDFVPAPQLAELCRMALYLYLR
jgi:hypothetical protein